MSDVSREAGEIVRAFIDRTTPYKTIAADREAAASSLTSLLALVEQQEKALDEFVDAWLAADDCGEAIDTAAGHAMEVLGTVFSLPSALSGGSDE